MPAFEPRYGDVDGDGDRDAGSGFSRRVLLLGAGKLAAFSAIAAELYRLQVVDGSRYALIAEDNRIGQHVLAPVRGRILDAAGAVLADNVETFRAVLIRGRSGGDIRHTLALVSRIVPLTADEQDRLVARSRRQSHFAPLVIAENLSFEQVAELSLLAPRLPGVSTEIAHRRRYHHGEAVGHVVGYVGGIERLALDDEPVLRLPGIRVGKAGVELGLEEELRGVAGAERLEVDARGRVLRTLDRTEPLHGRDAALTIDARLQAVVLKRLRQERRAAIVTLEIATGAILALASVPAYDPADAVATGTADAWRRRIADAEKPLFNRATGGLYPPGSTFKIVTALAALETGVIAPGEAIRCDGGIDYGGQHFRCWRRGGHGRVDLNRAICESCDVFFYEAARRSGIDAIARTARRLGLGATYPAGLAQQKPGIVPDAAWKRGATGRGWLGGETLLAGIGQGYVTATPLQLAVMTARLAGGRAVLPTIAAEDAEARRRAENAGFEPLGIDPRWLAVVREGLEAAVNDAGGTGANAAPEDRGIRVAGKTGTSQVSRTSSERGSSVLPWELRDHALFVGYAPVEAPRYAIAAVVEHGGGGGAAAAPLFRDVLSALLDHEAAPRAPRAGAKGATLAAGSTE